MSERLDLDRFKNPFLADTGTPEKTIPPLDDIGKGDTGSNCRSIHFPSSVSTSTEARTISDTTTNSASSIFYNLVTSTIRSHHNAEREEAR